MNDPFAPSGSQDAQEGSNLDPWQEDTPNVPNGPQATAQVVSENQNSVTVILKGGTGYGAPSISIRGADIADALEQMSQYEHQLQELVKKAAFYGKAFGQIVDGGSGGNGGGGQRQNNNGGGQSRGGGNGGVGGNYQNRGGGGQAGRPSNASEKPAGLKQEYCQHGEMEFKSGFSQKTQKTWKAFDCPAGECDRTWVNDKSQ